jgi:hypothetical protein
MFGVVQPLTQVASRLPKIDADFISSHFGDHSLVKMRKWLEHPETISRVRAEVDDEDDTTTVSVRLSAAHSGSVKHATTRKPSIDWIEDEGGGPLKLDVASGCRCSCKHGCAVAEPTSRLRRASSRAVPRCVSRYFFIFLFFSQTGDIAKVLSCWCHHVFAVVCARPTGQSAASMWSPPIARASARDRCLLCCRCSFCCAVLHRSHG